MILPFVRELLADAETTSSFQRAATHLKGGAGRIRVSGLTPTARALHYALLHRASARPLLLVVSDNRAAEELLPLLQSLCEMTGTATADSVAYLPARDVLPFENLSPHPEIQELRARALWRIASGTASLVVAPFAATAIRLRDAEYYRNLARIVRRGDWLDMEKLVQHLNIVGYRQTDVVEQQGEYAQRGGILDVYSPEMERPVRIELFGDEVESMRRFDPVTQRSAMRLEEAALLPLTETPVTEELLATINARLSGKRVSGSEEALEDAARAGGVTVFPGWEFFAPVAGAENTIFDLMADAAVVLDEPERLAEDHDGWWQRLQDAHERSGVGNLVRPEELYVTPEAWRERVAQTCGLDVEQLGLASSDGRELVEFSSRPTPRFHGAVPKLLEEVKKLSAAGERVMLVAGSMGELERLADIFNEYQVPYRLGTRAKSASVSEEATYFNDESAATTLIYGIRSGRGGVAGREAGTVRRQRSVRRFRGGCARAAEAALQDLSISVGLPRSGGWRLRGARGARHRPVPGIARDSAGGRLQERVHGSGICRGSAVVCSADPARSGAEVSLGRGRARGAESAGHAAVGEDQGSGEEGHAGHGRRAAETLRPAQDRARLSVLRRQPVHARV